VCCPGGWATTPLNTGLFCFTEMTTQGVERRQETETLGEDATSTLMAISGLVFTSAGVVTKEAAVGTGSSESVSVSGKITSTGTGTGTESAASASATKSSGRSLELGARRMWVMVGVMGILCILTI